MEEQQQRQQQQQQQQHHDKYMTALLLRSGLPSQLQQLWPQRMLLIYFAVSTLRLLNGGGDFCSAELKLELVRAVRECYCEHSGGFAATTRRALAEKKDVDATADTPSIVMTHCALHVLTLIGALRDDNEDGNGYGAAGLNETRDGICRFIRSCLRRNGSGGVASHGSCCGDIGSNNATARGESDVRFVYSALMSAFLLYNALSDYPPFLPGMHLNGDEGGADENTGDSPSVPGEWVAFLQQEAGIDVEGLTTYVLACQTYEGGFAGVPGGAEAHGGMTFCATSSLSLLGALHRCDVAGLLRYSVMRLATHTFVCDDDGSESGEEGGDSNEKGTFTAFQGRPGKPLDTCYTFWLGNTLAQLPSPRGRPTNNRSKINNSASDWLDMGDCCSAFVSACAEASHCCGVGKDVTAAADPMHTCLSLTGLHCNVAAARAEGAELLHPCVCLPAELVLKKKE